MSKTSKAAFVSDTSISEYFLLAWSSQWLLFDVGKVNFSRIPYLKCFKNLGT